MRRGHAGRVDLNQREIVRALCAVGCSVQSLASVGAGVPDLLVGYRGRNLLLEVKDGKGRERPEQVAWASGWRGQREVVRSVDDALRAVGAQ